MKVEKKKKKNNQNLHKKKKLNKKKKKKKKKTETFYVIDYLLELIIKIWQFEKKKSSKSGEFGSFFNHEKSLHIR
jgi:hypothetical protein